jgi:hypothetical protein
VLERHVRHWTPLADRAAAGLEELLAAPEAAGEAADTRNRLLEACGLEAGNHD